VEKRGVNGEGGVIFVKEKELQEKKKKYKKEKRRAVAPMRESKMTRRSETI